MNNPFEPSTLSRRDQISNEIGKCEGQINLYKAVSPFLREVLARKGSTDPQQARELEYDLEYAAFLDEQNRARLAKLTELRDKYFVI